jgi:hypothetical protein
MKDYDINCLAMAIVNHTNEVNKVSVDIRQANNDKCFDFVEEKIKDYLIGIDWASGKDMTVHTPPINKVGIGWLDTTCPPPCNMQGLLLRGCGIKHIERR